MKFTRFLSILLLIGAFGLMTACDDDSGNNDNNTNNINNTNNTNNVNNTNNANCGNGVIDAGETCDGTDFGGATCESEGATLGELACVNCQIDTAGCCTDLCTEGSMVCNGDTLRACVLDTTGCTIWEDTDCTTSGQICDDTLDPPACADEACVSDCTTEGESVCSGSDIETCTMVGECLEWTVTETCGGGTPICDDSAQPAVCLPDCVDSCDTDGDVTCMGDVLTVCEDSDGDGCLDLLNTTDCAANGDVCNPMNLVCETSGSGESCDDARTIYSFPYTRSGTDFVSEFAVDDHVFTTGTNCGYAQANAVEAVFKVNLMANDRLNFKDEGGMDFVLRLVTEDASTCLTTTSCIDSIDGGEETGITYDATFDQTVYVIYEAYYSSPGTTDYALTIDVAQLICGDGMVTGSETCDDGNATPGDGCDASCQVETGYDCTGEPSFCYTEGAGDVCSNPISITAPASFSFDTSSFVDDYGSEVAIDYTACGGSGGFGPDAVFAVDVPAGDILNVSGTNTVGNTLLVIAHACADLENSCTASDEATGDVAVSYANTTGSATTVFVILDSGNGFSTTDVSIDLDFALRTPFCGDGLIENGETCDDSNATPGDGCDASCQIETGFLCTGEPSVCAPGFSQTNTPAAAIPDNDATGVTDLMEITSACTIDTVSIDVDISHTWKGDVTLSLMAPDGTTVILHDQTGGSANDIIGNYPLDLTPAGDLADFAGLNGMGTWSLIATDSANGDTGTINEWTLYLTCQ